MEQYKVAFIGDYQTTLPFNSLGISIHVVNEEVDAAGIFTELIKQKKYAVIFITENLYEILESEIERVELDVLPSVIFLPQIKGSKGLGLNFLRETMKKAAGRDVMEEGEELSD